jgi:hypothetical protein
MSKKYKNLFMVEDFTASDGENRSVWTKVGVAFENRDGSFSLELGAFPVSGRLQMRDPRPPREEGDAGARRNGEGAA